MASTTGDGAEQAEPKAPAPTPPPPLSASNAVEAPPAVALKPAAVFGPPLTPDALHAAEASADHATAPVLAIPPVAVPKIRTAPPSQRSIKGETTASDYVAPRELPLHTPRPSESVDAKVVIDVPDKAGGGASGEAEVVEMRQRRRAQTMKIDRSKLSQLAQIDGARERSTQPDLPALPNALPASQLSPSNGSLRPATVEGHRPLARAAAEPRSPRGIGWAVVALATVVVGGGVGAIALGLVPGLGPTSTDHTAAPEARPAAAPKTAATPAETVEPAPSATPTVEPSASASAATPVPSATPAPSASVPYQPPFQNGMGTAVPTVRPAPRPRPRSDIPQGI